MRDILQDILPWYQAGKPFALATVVRTWRSSPRPVGASMAVSDTGEVIGSVSGGCVEGAVYEVAQDVLKTGAPQLVRYGVSDDSAFAIGLTCGGTLELFVQLIDADTFPEFEHVVESVARRQAIAICTVIEGPLPLSRRFLLTPSGTYGNPDLDQSEQSLAEKARRMLRHGTDGVLPHNDRQGGEVAVFVESMAPPPRMIVFGAIDFAAAVARIGKFLGYHVTVCDARRVFATKERFREADEVVVAWPHKYLAEVEVDERTVLCVLTHDAKFDVPLLQLALRTPAGYIGAMGSRRTHDIRLAQLRDSGTTEEELSRLRSPIGLDLGARTPEETAISIAAEIISTFQGGSGLPLANTTAPIHHKPLASHPKPPVAPSSGPPTRDFNTQELNSCPL
ncbi:XdhC family protein [Arthrobacter crystallopoietes]|uniref:Xanthine dehydrogenase accessory factor n=1 Tax=Crystallibacter crystallopoietes TaxID=37928 RepID=A0A1H1HWI7_9MICC|nr:XdhC family protein [Arthrobacter crystallopoietes]AUI53810.1 XshC-Cox1 family protein [Arthrobacter crystallopoietes]SDR29783.1 xanthine dehydrogenase accessory factor [Arthrobacter crystallopoietes]